MVNGVNETLIVSQLWDKILPVLMDKAGPLINIFKAVGIVLLIYIIYLIIKGIVKWKDRRRLKRIEEKVLEIDEKLDKLIGRKEKKKKKGKK